MDPDRASPPEMPPGKTNLRKRKDQARARVAEETAPLDTAANVDVRSPKGA